MADAPSGLVTFLLTDVVGSTAQWDDEPEAASAAMAVHDEIVDGAVERAGGFRPVEQGEGDSVVAAFRRATDAAACALDIRRRLAEAGGPVIRTGLHAGEAEPRSDVTYRGAVLNRCARLRSAAHGRQILVSNAVHEMLVDHLPDGVSFLDLGIHRLRGLSRPEHVWELRDDSVSESFPALETTHGTPHNLPTTLTSFVGRRAEVESVVEAIESNRLVTITGAGGCGKTRLAVEVGRRMLDVRPGGVRYVDLASGDDPDLVASAVAGVVGVSESLVEPLVDTLCRELDRDDTLLVLDNCEHLTDACAALATTLASSCPSLTTIVTSREPLGIDGESVWRLPSLSLPAADAHTVSELERSEAAQLFVDRARAATPGLRITDDDIPFVVDICRRLDGIPLALELAASRTRLLSLGQIADALNDRFRLLIGGSRGSLPRQRTLEASVEWSYDLLSPVEQTLFRELAVFSGSFDLQAVEAVCTGKRVLDALTGLVDRSLVQVEADTGVARYRMLETVHVFARRLLIASDDADATRDRHLAHFEALARRVEPHLEGPDLGEWLERLDLDIANLRAALDWSVASAQEGAGVVLVGRLVHYWFTRSALGVGIERLEAPVTADSGDSEEIVPARCALALVRYREGRILEAVVDADHAVELGASLGGVVHARALACRAMMGVFLAEGERPGGAQFFEEAVEVARRSGDAYATVQALTAFGGVRMDVEYAEARRALEEASRLAHEHEIVRLQLDSSYFLGLLEVTCGDVDEALDRVTTMVDLADELADPWFSTVGRQLLSVVLCTAGALDEAEEVQRAMETLLDRHPSPMGASMLQAVAAALATRRGDIDLGLELGRVASESVTMHSPRFAARVWSERAQTIVRWRPDDAHPELDRLRSLDESTFGARALSATREIEGRLYLHDGELHDSEDTLHEALTIAWSNGLLPQVLDVLESLAEAVAAQERHAEAVRILAACATIRAHRRISGGVLVERAAETLGHRLRDALGDEEFDTAWTAGAAMDIDALVADVRRGRGERGRPPLGWDSLTPTEEKVIDLVADGLTNPQIGERLHISKRTVQTHLAHVFTKLDMSSRTEVAAALVERRARADRTGDPSA